MKYNLLVIVALVTIVSAVAVPKPALQANGGLPVTVLTPAARIIGEF
jgi:hypothetical protein